MGHNEGMNTLSGSSDNTTGYNGTKERKQTDDYNKYSLITTLSGLFVLEALGDRLIIQEDKFKTGYECHTCDGDGFIKEDCGFCVGRGKPPGYEDVNNDNSEGTPCRLCSISRGMWGMIQGQGLKTCIDCNGKGATIVIPQQSERRPTSGVIHSMGPDVENKKLCPGTRVLYTIFAGTAIDFKGKGTCRIMHENEIMGVICGKANLGDIVK